MVKNSAANTGDVRDAGSIPGLGRSPGVTLPKLRYSRVDHGEGGGRGVQDGEHM